MRGALSRPTAGKVAEQALVMNTRCQTSSLTCRQHLSISCVVLHCYTCHNQDCLIAVCWRPETEMGHVGAAVNHAVSNWLRRVWSEYFDFQRRFQRWQAAHQALLAGTISAAAPEVIFTPEKQVNSKSSYLQSKPNYGRRFVSAPAQVDNHD